jgi:hypothetical protein
LENHRTLALDLVGIEARMEKDIGQEIYRQGQIFVENFGVVARFALSK